MSDRSASSRGVGSVTSGPSLLQSMSPLATSPWAATASRSSSVLRSDCLAGFKMGHVTAVSAAAFWTSAQLQLPDLDTQIDRTLSQGLAASASALAPASSPAPAPASASASVSVSVSASQRHTRPKHATLAGGLAGIAEILCTYPLEYAKSQQQLAQRGHSLASVIKTTVTTNGTVGLYRGMSPFLCFAAPKVGVRFTTFDFLCGKITDDMEHEQLGAAETALVGGATGVVESLAVGVITNTLSVRMLADSNSVNPRFTGGLLHTVRTIVAEEGIRGIYRGVAPTVAKMATNQALRFTVFGWAQRTSEVRAGRKLNALESLAAGSVAGAVSVFATAPIDTVKTRMQGAASVARGQKAPSAFEVAGDILRREGGLRVMYRGIAPRLIRVSAEAALQFTFFSCISDFLDTHVRDADV